MRKKFNFKNIRYALIIVLIITSIPLFIINGQIWVLNWFIVWNIIVAILFISFLMYIEKKETKKPKRKASKLIIILCFVFIIVSPILLAFISFPLATYPVKYIRAEFNKDECKRIVNELTSDCTNETQKTIAILNWFERFSGKIYNTYGSVDIGPLYFGGGVIFDYMLCVRPDDRQPILWVLTSRCGSCGEHGTLFTAMVTQAGLEARTILCEEADHVWAEVKINDTWLIMEPANVVHRDNKTGFNMSPESFERTHGDRTKNLSYIVAEYPNRETEDITYRYTNLTHINITTVDENRDILPNIEISVISYNRFPDGVETGYKCFTDENGKCQLSLGGGDLKIIAQNADIIPMYGENRSYFHDDSSVDIILELNQDWTKNIYLVVSVLIFGLILIFIALVLIGKIIINYYQKRKHIP